MKAIQITQTGGPEVLHLRDIDAPVPSEDEVLVDVQVAGVNYIDTYYREGVYHAALPFVPGLEGTGRVAYDPRGEIAEGTVVAWCDAFGSYAEQVCVPRDRLVAVPEGVSPDVAASMLLQGITAQYLTNGVYDLKEGDSCLITAGAGGVGLLVTQMAAAKGARVFSVVSSDEKEKLALEAGATEVFRYSDNLAEVVRRRNDGVGVDVVYDGVGKDTFLESLEAVRPRGTVCLFGAASGLVEPFDPQLLNTHGSIFLTRPSIGAWTAGEGEFRMRAQAVTQAVVDGTLKFRVSSSYPLAEAAQAHRDLHARKTTGSIVLQVQD
ncbi:quinone oxidoreductase [Corynebacterium testudinoris]|uniref:Zn-dependent oxidoreductase, NADPH:quinone reductase n=1 Tax=Corynebacterium testudinoris TaxID=136857 RepID=A0A0G3H620_9CORY|nr:quinone oxidoreductase [Corynebacterium testudinoris]AKK08846.1 Zn-dependent oxidoreductase, NADPH:quinone reductase [Corynebacterium testudinoris]MBX8994901.1 quinone oxidoreductase [Corynebacterium testudinoris]